MTLREIEEKLGATLDAPSNAPDTHITGVAGIEAAGPGQITFVSNPKYAAPAKTTRASAVLVTPDFPGLPTATTAALRTANPYLAFAKAIELFYQPPKYAPGIHPTAVIAKSARIGENAHIGPYCFIDEDAHIGRN